MDDDDDFDRDDDDDDDGLENLRDAAAYIEEIRNAGVWKSVEELSTHPAVTGVAATFDPAEDGTAFFEFLGAEAADGGFWVKGTIAEGTKDRDPHVWQTFVQPGTKIMVMDPLGLKADSPR